MESQTGTEFTPRLEEEIDDRAATLAPASIAGSLQDWLGQKTAARLVGLGDAKQLGRYRKAGGPKPRPTIDLRLREAYKLVGPITLTLGAQVARSWLLGTNSRLGDRTPIDAFRAATEPEDLMPIRAAARRFLLSEATVRDPFADPDAVRAALRRPMSERLELALSWNPMTSELRDGLTENRSS